jgi:hypothetical protein
VTSGEDEAEEIIADALVCRPVHFDALLITLDIASDRLVLALESLAAADHVEGSMLCSPHEPGGGPLRYTFDGPLLERRNEGILCKLLSRPDVANDASQPRDEPGRLYPPNRLDLAVRL